MARYIKHCVAKRSDLIQVHDHCPERPYIELEVPKDAKAVVAVSFTVNSRDQGWADRKEGPSFTWFDAAVARPQGRSDLRIITVTNNRIANVDFFEQTVRWHLNDGIRRRSWVEGLRPGDVVQLIPKANYLAWVNIIKECSIKIEYEVKEVYEEIAELRSTSQASHYANSLNLGPQEIRLLMVEPGSFDDPIYASFQKVGLGDGDSGSPDFDALSYCWGDPTNRADIYLGSPANLTSDVPWKIFSVGRAVDAALRRLRHENKPLRIWIDAICINQEDLEERAHQVALMRQIYSLAKKVHIWLGESIVGVEQCLQLVRDIYNFNNRECPGGELCLCPGTRHSIAIADIDGAIEEKKKEGHGPSFRGMYEVFRIAEKSFSRQVVDLAGWYNNTQLSTLMSVLFENPWFARVWVIQEALLAQEALVRCSGEIVPWKEVLAVNEWLENPQYTTQQRHIKSQKIMAPVWKRLRPGGMTSKSHASHTRAREAPSHGEVSSILDVFLAGLDLKATDSRDKLFALLAFSNETYIINDLDQLIRPNYDKSEQRVFADFTRWWIREHGSLSILSAIHSQTGRTWQRTHQKPAQEQPAKRPTWAVSDEGRSRWAKANLNAQFNFRATRGRLPSSELLNDSDPLVLRLLGHRVSVIKALGHVPIEAMFPYIHEPDRRIEISTVFDRILDPCAFSGFWGVKSIEKDEENTSQRATMEYFDHVRAHWQYFPSSKVDSLQPTGKPELQWYQTDKVPTCFDQCFFVTEIGACGLCPWTAKEGDVVALLHGGKVPYLLRPVGEAGQQNYELVGECYVYGIMHGEFLANAGEGEIFNLV